MKHLAWIVFIFFALSGCGTTSSSGGGSSSPPSGGSSGAGGASGGSSSGGTSAGGGAAGGASAGGSSGGGSAGAGDSEGGSTSGGSSSGGTEGGIDVDVGVDVGGVNIPLPGGTPGIPGMPGLPDRYPTGSGDGSGTASTGQDIPVWEPEPSFGDSEEADRQNRPGSSGSNGSDSDNASLEDIEKTLDEAMGTFDEEILREQENARNKTGNNGSGAGSNAGVLAGVGTFETYGENGGEQGGGRGSASGSAGTAEKSNAGIAIEDGPPPSPDDDIVARQIREAAENEPDPEQRAVLWEEYKRYKNGQ